MIGRLTGRVVECRPDHLVVDVNGVGYHLHIPLSTYYVVHRSADAPVTLHVHTRAREDALQLYGFASTAERSMFETLTGISGVGPRLALAFLSGIGVEELYEAVYREDRTRLQKIPGVGRKTAERVLLELRDRLGPEDESRRTRGAQGLAGRESPSLTRATTRSPPCSTWATTVTPPPGRLTPHATTRARGRASRQCSRRHLVNCRDNRFGARHPAAG